MTRSDLNFPLILCHPPARLQRITDEGGPNQEAGEGEGCESSSIHKAMGDGSSCKEGGSSCCPFLGIHHRDAEDLLNDTAVFLLWRVQDLLV